MSDSSGEPTTPPQTPSRRWWRIGRGATNEPIADDSAEVSSGDEGSARSGDEESVVRSSGDVEGELSSAFSSAEEGGKQSAAQESLGKDAASPVGDEENADSASAEVTEVEDGAESSSGDEGAEQVSDDVAEASSVDEAGAESAAPSPEDEVADTPSVEDEVTEVEDGAESSSGDEDPEQASDDVAQSSSVDEVGEEGPAPSAADEAADAPSVEDEVTEVEDSVELSSGDEDPEQVSDDVAESAAVEDEIAEVEDSAAPSSGDEDPEQASDDGAESASVDEVGEERAAPSAADDVADAPTDDEAGVAEVEDDVVSSSDEVDVEQVSDDGAESASVDEAGAESAAPSPEDEAAESAAVEDEIAEVEDSAAPSSGDEGAEQASDDVVESSSGDEAGAESAASSAADEVADAPSGDEGGVTEVEDGAESSSGDEDPEPSSVDEAGEESAAPSAADDADDAPADDEGGVAEVEDDVVSSSDEVDVEQVSDDVAEPSAADETADVEDSAELSSDDEELLEEAASSPEDEIAAPFSADEEINERAEFEQSATRSSEIYEPSAGHDRLVPAGGEQVGVPPWGTESAAPTEPEPTAPSRRRWWIGGSAVAALLAALYVGAGAAAGGTLPRGTTIEGIEVGSTSPARAEQLVRDGLEKRTSQPLRVIVGDDATKPVAVNGAEAGLALDARASVEEAGGGSTWSPASLWKHYFGGGARDAVVSIDEAKMADAIDAINGEAGRPAVNGSVRFVDGEVRTSAPRDGVGVEPKSTQDLLARAWIGESRDLSLKLTTRKPEIGATAVETFVNDFATQAVSGPIILKLEKGEIELSPAEFTKAIRIKPVDGQLQSSVATKALDRVVASKVGDEGAPVDATVTLVNGTPQVVPAKPGVKVRAADVAKSLLTAAVAEGDQRSIAVKARVAQPEFSTEEAEKLGIKEEVSEFTTNFPHADYRNINIGRAAELVDGTVIKPGETFSLNGIVGERTAANGFTEGFMIRDGILESDLGGGVSQMATTTFNAAFFAGMTDVEHKPHSFYIDRYPVGREATVAWPTLDLKFRNDTPYGILVSSKLTPSTYSSQGALTVRMYSTKYWDITARASGRYNFTTEKTRRIDTLKCHANEGYGGFDIDVWRDWRRHGSSTLERSEKMHTTYIPSDTVICTNPNATD